METLLVLPLFLMLLGILFLLGDLLQGRLLQLSMDRTVTWLGGGTVYRENLEKTFSKDLGLELSDSRGWMGPRFRTDRLNSGYFAKQPDPGKGAEGDKAQGNAWLDTYMGRADLEIGVPLWAPLLDVQRNMMASGPEQRVEPTPSLFDLRPETTGFPDPKGRAQLIRRRRRSLATEADFYRGKPASDLEAFKIVFDVWPEIERPAASSGSFDPSSPYRRHPVAVLIGE